VGKEIVLTDLNTWNKHGTIFTQNKIDYSFIFRFFDKCIGSISLGREEELEKLKSNIYIFKETKGLWLIHGGKNPYSLTEKPKLEYEERNRALNKSTMNCNRINETII